MAAWQASAGATLLIPSGPAGHHLFVVLCDPVLLAGYGPHLQVVLVNLSSIRAGIPHDATCVVQPGEHPFVVQPSYVVYSGMRIYKATELAGYVARGLFAPHHSMSPVVLQRIQAGRLTSPRTTQEFRLLQI
jgi:hypothetical protein